MRAPARPASVVRLMPSRPPDPSARHATRVAAAALVAVATAALPAPARAQAPGVGVPAATIPVTDPATGLVEQLVALVPVPGATVGQRPYATREVVRLARQALAEVERRDRARRPARVARPGHEERAAIIAGALLDALAPAGAAAPRGLTLRPLDFAWAHAVGGGAPTRFSPDNGIGRLDAATLPSLDLRFGRPATRGVVGSVETAHALGVGGWLALVAQPRFSLVTPYAGGLRPGDARWTAEPQRLYARAVGRNVALQLGLDEWTWGQGGAGGVFLSASARPLRAVTLASDTAFALPGALRRLGRWRAAALAADLGRAQNFPHAKLYAYKVNLAARPTVELGLGMMSQAGGFGAPPMSPLQRAADLFPFVTWLNEGSDRLSTNKVANLEARVRVPRWRGLSVAYELTVDDVDFRRVRSMLWEDSGNLLAVQLPRLAADGSLALDLRAQRTGLRLYRHYQFVSGVTYRDQVLGSPLGPNGAALAGALTWRPAPFDALSFSLAHERRDPSVFANVNPDPDGALIFRQVRALPVDRRLRGEVRWERGLAGRGASTTARLGLERAADVGGVVTPARTRPFGEAGVRLRF